MKALHITAGIKVPKYIIQVPSTTNHRVNYRAKNRKDAEILAGNTAIAIFKIKLKKLSEGHGRTVSS